MKVCKRCNKNRPRDEFRRHHQTADGRVSICNACIPPPPVQLPRQPCGTLSAYRRHHRHGEPPCETCRAAYNGWRRRRDAEKASKHAPLTAKASWEEGWGRDAACLSADPEMFFPEKGGSTRDALRICNGDDTRPPCPVRGECLEWALENDERFGVWGGVPERERRKMKRFAS